MEKTRIKRIAVVGAESTGKTWLCENLAKHYNTVWVPEYAREYFNDSDIYNYTLNDLIIIAERQIQMENEALGNAKRFLFCDTSMVTLKIWADLEFTTTPDLINHLLVHENFDHYLVTDNSQPWVYDVLRQNKFSREMILQMNIDELKKMNADYTLIQGTEQTRLQQAIFSVDRL